MIKHLSVVLLLFFINASGLFAQKTPEELGENTFRYFRNNNLDSFFLLIPTMGELSTFSKSIGIDSNAQAYKEFVERYPLVINHFKNECMVIYSDSDKLGFSWVDAVLEKVVATTKELSADKSYPGIKPPVITIINIYFLAGNKKLRLQLGDANKYNEIWKPGNNIKLTVE